MKTESSRLLDAALLLEAEANELWDQAQGLRRRAGLLAKTMPRTWGRARGTKQSILDAMADGRWYHAKDLVLLGAGKAGSVPAILSRLKVDGALEHNPQFGYRVKQGDRQ